ncbi:serine hydrolase domain-containing protein [Ruania alba]|uniref:CubicO group peptidase, beta-lactamase class C family n=1 Tax=Ruania alba TaxID=648782 RepID=A0A1H5N3U7_9MICO|nr:serine hydrolase domain-containing protein [Ruania alba]SEE96223.1 CubicO group peptidase, beta-lactamase class C family [Ruania alba]
MRTNGQASALQEDLERLLREATTSAGGDPVSAIPGAAAGILHRGRTVAHATSGVTALVDDEGEPLAEREAITPDLVWDIASLTKIVVTVAALVQSDAGTLDLDRPVVRDLPEFVADIDGGVPGRESITPRHLLTHTAGLPAACEPWMVDGDRGERSAYVLSRPLLREPGTAHEYSCVGYLTLGLLLERITGMPLPELVSTTVTGPLGMRSTAYGPVLGRRAVPTEYQPAMGRGLVRGVVHDEAAWTLGGAGNAGVFSDVSDLLTFGAEICTGTQGLLSEQSRAGLATGTLPGSESARIGYDQAFGLRLGHHRFMGTTDRGVLGHTGFTGTSLVIDPDRELVIVLLTNAVHPVRGRHDPSRLRQDVVSTARGWASTAG